MTELWHQIATAAVEVVSSDEHGTEQDSQFARDVFGDISMGVPIDPTPERLEDWATGVVAEGIKAAQIVLLSVRHHIIQTYGAEAFAAVLAAARQGIDVAERL